MTLCSAFGVTFKAFALLFSCYLLTPFYYVCPGLVEHMKDRATATYCRLLEVERFLATMK